MELAGVHALAERSERSTGSACTNGPVRRCARHSGWTGSASAVVLPCRCVMHPAALEPRPGTGHQRTLDQRPARRGLRFLRFIRRPVGVDSGGPSVPACAVGPVRLPVWAGRHWIGDAQACRRPERNPRATTGTTGIATDRAGGLRAVQEAVDVLLRGIGLSADGLVDMLAGSIDGSSSTVWAAWAGEQIVASSMFWIDQEVAYFAGMATLAEHRSQGAQSGLIAAQMRPPPKPDAGGPSSMFWHPRPGGPTPRCPTSGGSGSSRCTPG